MIKTISIAIIMGIIWGSSFPISQIGVLHIGAFPFRFATIFVSTLTMFIFSFSYLKSSLFNLTKQDYFKLFLLCVPNIFLVPLINNISLGLTSVSSATFLIYMMPCITSIFSIFLTKKIHALTMIAITLCAFGVMLLSKTNHFQLGEYLISINAIIWALGAILSQQIIFKNIHMSVKVTIQMLFTLLLTTFVTIIWYLNNAVDISSIARTIVSTPSVLFSILYIGSIGSALVYFLWFTLIKMESAEFTTYSTLLSPVISIYIAVTYFGEELDPMTTVGGGLILTSSLIVIVIQPLYYRIKNRLKLNHE
ncbi:DMT family transporter [Aliivibrio fischeri]|uniref:DMT family transporter n=2 Tax=Aliivibrio fischeri TaxID=668 RepID=UPI0007C4DBCF|nr:DMT family transporter [Aliivibrio fischeri]MBP3140835.1 DMT family transporter [Aliivibrio fischeri]MBP3155858.1 DMT family transporter [Aliivibrio fischeri]MCE7575291.1 DMT family transporter [Aliivibrio fischeri]MCE7576182.1 DMT family transporter [Aliivibrio fischeri]MCE7588472.1 DMT family transporter [Aliivibrio fischeri]